MLPSGPRRGVEHAQRDPSNDPDLRLQPWPPGLPRAASPFSRLPAPVPVAGCAACADQLAQSNHLGEPRKPPCPPKEARTYATRSRESNGMNALVPHPSWIDGQVFFIRPESSKETDFCNTRQLTMGEALGGTSVRGDQSRRFERSRTLPTRPARVRAGRVACSAERGGARSSPLAVNRRRVAMAGCL